ncbi:MAG: 30S ribosomal protein S6 [Limisphaerales bacterium]
MKSYQGLFILNTAGKAEGADAVIADVTQAIVESGGKVGEVQKHDNRPFSRVVDKKITSGFYATIPFEVVKEELDSLTSKLNERPDVHRLLVTNA